MKKYLKRYHQQSPTDNNFKSYQTICGQVSNRVPKLKTFCRKYDVIIFVSGANSSNGKFLFSVCQKENQNSYFISSPAELEIKWLKNVKSVGISGATSTPHWLMEEVAQKISVL